MPRRFDAEAANARCLRAGAEVMRAERDRDATKEDMDRLAGVYLGSGAYEYQHAPDPTNEALLAKARRRPERPPPEPTVDPAASSWLGSWFGGGAAAPAEGASKPQQPSRGDPLKTQDGPAFVVLSVPKEVASTISGLGSADLLQGRLSVACV